MFKYSVARSELMGRQRREEEVPPVTPGVEEVKARGRLVRSDDRYAVYDYVRDGNTYSVTELRPHGETRGHRHDEVDEYYFFKEGRGTLTIGERVYEVDADSMGPSRPTFKVPRGEFHRVKNQSSRTLTFLATFAGSREEARAVYPDEKGEAGSNAGARGQGHSLPRGKTR